VADNKKMGNAGKSYQDIWLQSNLGKITHPQRVADTLNSHFIDKVEELVEKNRSNGSNRSSQILVDSNPNSYVFFPISEGEIVTVVSKLKAKASAGADEIPDFIEKECTECIKNHLISYLINP
jgi:hypothetical protein